MRTALDTSARIEVTLTVILALTLGLVVAPERPWFTVSMAVFCGVGNWLTLARQGSRATTTAG